MTLYCGGCLCLCAILSVQKRLTYLSSSFMLCMMKNTTSTNKSCGHLIRIILYISDIHLKNRSLILSTSRRYWPTNNCYLSCWRNFFFTTSMLRLSPWCLLMFICYSLVSTTNPKWFSFLCKRCLYRLFNSKSRCFSHLLRNLCFIFCIIVIWWSYSLDIILRGSCWPCFVSLHLTLLSN